MNRLASPLARLSLASLALLLGIGCSTTQNQTPAGVPGTDVTTGLDGGGDTGGSDTGAGGDTTGTADATPTGDAAVQDVLADTVSDTADVAIADAKVDAADVKTDVKTDIKTDVPDTSTPKKCLTDKDCKAAGFGDCLGVGCNVASGKCELNAAVDGKSCAVKGPCGGSGTCKKGACNFTSACGAQPCTPQVVKCGDKLTLAAGAFGTSVLNSYGCSATKWDGGEKILSLTSDATTAVVATVTLSDDSSPSAMLFDIGASSGVCSPGTCDVTGTKLTIGLPAGASRTLVVDTIKGDSGPIIVTITCAPVLVCGDGACNGTETQKNCPKDCGSALTTCGNGKCDAATENCLNCAGDCGACPAECKSDGSKGCAGCACEACVCKGPIPGGDAKGDDYCCTTAWDSTCASECGKCGGATCPEATATCGDNNCDFDLGEDGVDCPNDCPPPMTCGDGVCVKDAKSPDPLDSESCTSCAQDCGICTGPVASCGDGKCSANEQCATCPVDCGECSKACGEPAGCGGCGCEAEVCASDAYCCSTKWDSTCVSECKATGKADGGALLCPADKCGDGYCSGTETCSSCSKDCGACPAVCGNGKCEAGEDKVSCAKDCGCGNGKCDAGEDKVNCVQDCAIGCEGKCGKSSPSTDTDGSSCYCDSICTSSNDCCTDKVQFCGK